MKQIGIIVVVVWLLFFKGCSTLTNVSQQYGPGVVTTIQRGAELSLTPPISIAPTSKPAGFSIPTARPGAPGVPAAAAPTPALVATAPPTPTTYCGTDGNLYRNGVVEPRQPDRGCGSVTGGHWGEATATLAPTRDYVAEAQAARDASVPEGERHYVQTPGDTYFTVGESRVRYYIDGAGHIVDTRLPASEPTPAAEVAAAAPAGAPPEQKIFLNPSDPTDAAYLASQPTAGPRTSCTKGCGR